MSKSPSLCSFLLIFATYSTCLVASSGSVSAQEKKAQEKKAKDPMVGRRVMTIEWAAEFKLSKDIVGIVELGKVYTIDGVNENWYHFRGKHGWMKKDFVIPVEQAVTYFTSEVNESPEAKNYHHRGIAWRERGEYEKALKDIDFAIKINDQEASYHNSRGTVFHRQEKYQQARENYDKALALKPNNIGFLNNRGIAYRELGDFDNALKDFNEAIKLAPNYAYAYGSKSWLLSTAREDKYLDGKTAVELAKTACELTKWKEDDLLGTLAAAYARDGDFEQAKKWLKSAATIDPGKYPEMRKKMQDSFEDHKPFVK